MPYGRFRLGLTFRQVRQDLAVEQHQAREAGQYKYVTRKTVLGRMRQLKLSAYEHYLEHMEER